MAAPVGCPGGSTRQSSPAVPWRDDRSPSGHGTHPGAGGTGFLLAWNAICREPDLQRMRLRNVEETTGAVASIHCRGSDGTLGDRCRRSLPCHPDREPILPHGGMLLFKMTRVFPHPGPEGHDGC